MDSANTYATWERVRVLVFLLLFVLTAVAAAHPSDAGYQTWADALSSAGVKP